MSSTNLHISDDQDLVKLYKFVQEIFERTVADVSEQRIHFCTLQADGPDDSPDKMEARRHFKEFFEMKRRFTEYPPAVKDVKENETEKDHHFFDGNMIEKSEVEEPTFTEADSTPDTTAVIIPIVQENDNQTEK